MAYESYDAFMMSQMRLSPRKNNINHAKRVMRKTFKESPSYFSVQINDEECIDTWVVDDSNVRDQKLIICLDYQLQNGDIINWQNENWINILTDNMSDIYYRGTLRRCNGTLYWQTSTGTTLSYHFTFKSDPATNFGVEDGRIMSLGNERRTLLINADEESKKVAKGKRFIFDSRAWKVTAIDSISVNGLLTLTVEESEIDSSKDNLELEIADYIPPTPLPVEPEPVGFSVVIEGSDSIKKGMSQSYAAEVYANGVLVTNRSITWQLFDVDGVSLTEYASIESVNGLNCVVKAGTVIGRSVKLKAVLVGDTTVFDEKEIKIKGLY